MTKMYKRLLAMVLAVLMALSMAACGGDSKAPAQETKTTPAASDAPAPSGEKQKIVIWNNNTNENQLKALEAQMNDIAAELGTPVAACAKGTVSAVTTDDLMGTTVTIDHGKGMESVYANLSPSLNVQAGTEVDAGTVLGTVGTSAIAESASPSHLHFALREYGVTIDPGHYLH